MTKAGAWNETIRVHPAVAEKYRGVDLSQPIPDADAVTNRKFTMAFDPVRLYGKMEWPGAPEGELHEMLFVCEGAISHTLDRRRNKPEQLFIRERAKGHHMTGFTSASTILWTYRLFAPWFRGVQTNDFRDLGKRETVNGTECVLVEWRDRTPWQVSTITYWLNPERDFHIVRQELSSQTILQGIVSPPRLRSQTDVSYLRDEVHGWVPIEWRRQSFSLEDGKVRFTSLARVVSYEINPELDEKQFALEHTPGTVVVDEIANKRYEIPAALEHDACEASGEK